MPVNKYSIILPTYNERENISICIYLIHKYLTKQCAPANSGLRACATAPCTQLTNGQESTAISRGVDI